MTYQSLNESILELRDSPLCAVKGISKTADKILEYYEQNGIPIPQVVSDGLSEILDCVQDGISAYTEMEEKAEEYEGLKESVNNLRYDAQALADELGRLS